MDWIAESGLLIHFQVLDPLYWSTVDIVDSIFTSARFSLSPFELNQVKDALYAVFRGNMEATLSFFHKFRYPDIQPEQREAFIDALHMMCVEQVDELSDDQCRAIEWLLTIALQARSLPFIEDNERHTLIAEFGTFYWHRAYLLVNQRIFSMKNPK